MSHHPRPQYQTWVTYQAQLVETNHTHFDCTLYQPVHQLAFSWYQLDVAVCISFWWDAASVRRFRQALEKELILKWRSPFNKENWERWGQPFG
ncbi:hypothetical protein [Trichocoleus sp. FACHB-69]|uniref:hypothetical protein n=1 Tax=Cyanophyceae TaxID=3028117 RepID=UPI0016870FC7|nr:hypothetical protein [Trichocoleus sp. FACHB-69]MBD1935628.1 hypothetical protein [Trichocoleus sp. FACHB-69]